MAGDAAINAAGPTASSREQTIGTGGIVQVQPAGKTRPERAVVPTGAVHFGLKLEVEALALV